MKKRLTKLTKEKLKDFFVTEPLWVGSQWQQNRTFVDVFGCCVVSCSGRWVFLRCRVKLKVVNLKKKKRSQDPCSSSEFCLSSSIFSVWSGAGTCLLFASGAFTLTVNSKRSQVIHSWRGRLWSVGLSDWVGTAHDLISQKHDGST